MLASIPAEAFPLLDRKIREQENERSLKTDLDCGTRRTACADAFEEITDMFGDGLARIHAGLINGWFASRGLFVDPQKVSAKIHARDVAVVAIKLIFRHWIPHGGLVDRKDGHEVFRRIPPPRPTIRAYPLRVYVHGKQRR